MDTPNKTTKEIEYNGKEVLVGTYGYYCLNESF